MASFYIYDYETFGKNPSQDRPAQFAGVRTDMDFNIIEEPLVIYCAPANDYLPEPEAVMITGITPQQARIQGVNEAEFARQIHKVFSIPGTCILGYNNIRFDDEVSRNIFYRSFYDPYAYSWENGNSRWDLLNVMYACYALCPDGIIWPKNKDGLPSFRLENLTRANGIQHTQAHDAISDVYATIFMAKKVKEAQPALFDFLLRYRYKKKLHYLIDLTAMTPLVHVSSTFGVVCGNTSWVAPLAWHPVNKNALITCDLSGDLTTLLTFSSDQLRKQIYSHNDAIIDKSPVLPLKLVYINKCPVLAPAKMLMPENAERLGINRQICRQNLRLLRKYPQVREKVVALFSTTTSYNKMCDVDYRLYDGFFSNADKAAIRQIQQTQPKDLATLNFKYKDNRIQELFFRFRARNYPTTLNSNEKQRWLQYRQAVLSKERVQNYLLQLKTLHNLYADDKEKIALLNALFDYVYELTTV